MAKVYYDLDKKRACARLHNLRSQSQKLGGKVARLADHMNTLDAQLHDMQHTCRRFADDLGVAKSHLDECLDSSRACQNTWTNGTIDDMRRMRTTLLHAKKRKRATRT